MTMRKWYYFSQYFRVQVTLVCPQLFIGIFHPTARFYFIILMKRVVPNINRCHLAHLHIFSYLWKRESFHPSSHRLVPTIGKLTRFSPQIFQVQIQTLEVNREVFIVPSNAATHHFSLIPERISSSFESKLPSSTTKSLIMYRVLVLVTLLSLVFGKYFSYSMSNLLIFNYYRPTATGTPTSCHSRRPSHGSDQLRSSAGPATATANGSTSRWWI